jgi:hypothetical protein
VRTDCPTPYLCKNGSLGLDWSYAGIFKGPVPVVVLVNSPLTGLYTSTIDLVEAAYNAAYCGPIAKTCRDRNRIYFVGVYKITPSN